jgi:hypothetical protein
MKHRALYCRMMYSMAYVFAAAIVAFSALGIPNDMMISLAISCLVAAGFLSIRSDEQGKKFPNVKMTTIDEELEEARKAAEKEAK